MMVVSHHLLSCCSNPETTAEMSEDICAFLSLPQLLEGTGTAVATSCLILRIRITLISSTINIQEFNLITDGAEAVLEHREKKELL